MADTEYAACSGASSGVWVKDMGGWSEGFVRGGLRVVVFGGRMGVNSMWSSKLVVVVVVDVEGEGEGADEGEMAVYVNVDGADPAVKRVEGASRTKLCKR